MASKNGNWPFILSEHNFIHIQLVNEVKFEHGGE